MSTAAAKKTMDQGAQANITQLALGMADAARACGCGRAFFYQLLAKGEGPRTFYLGRRRLVRTEVLARWLQAREAAESAGGCREDE